MSVLSDFRERYLVRFWSPLPALVALGVASAYYFAITGTFWAVTGEFTRWGGHIISWFGYTPQEWSYFKLIGLAGTPLDRIDGVMIIGMLLARSVRRCGQTTSACAGRPADVACCRA